jgi:phytoene synthase
MLDPYAHCEALVRAADKDRFLAGLYAPHAKRAHLCALYAFAHEIARVSDVARQPLAGEIRLQWWRDALGGERASEVLANPVGAALLATIRECALPTAPLAALIDAHGFDLYDEAMPSLAELDSYVERTAATVFALAATILDDGGNADAAAAARAAGCAWGIASILRTFPGDRSRRRMFIPSDLLAQHGVAWEDIEARRNSAGLRGALATLRARSCAKLDEFRAAASTLSDACAPAFLSLAAVPVLLARLEAAAADPFTSIEVPQWRRQWAIWRAARKWPAL